MINFPKVSILIPVYNREKIILETLNSAVNQTYKNTEIIVVDNKSTDNSYKIIKKFAKSHPNVRVYQNEENIGPVRNWRRCLDYATGKYAKILWSDDLIAPDFIEKTLPYLEDHEDVGFVFTGTEIFNDNTGQRNKAYFIGNTGIYDTSKYIESSLLGKPLPVPISPGNAIFRRKDLQKNLLINIPNRLGIDFKMYGMGNDVLMFLLTAKDYPKFGFINETLSFFRSHNDSITISESGYKTCIRYTTGKAYFVENYVTDLKIIKQFNSKLAEIYFRDMYNKKYGLTSVNDFYYRANKIQININIGYFISLLAKSVFTKIRNGINLKIKKQPMKNFTSKETREFVSKPLFDEKILLNKNPFWPKLSIVTPSLNQGQFLERTILSVLNQNYPNLEYIIIDGGSTDGSVEIIKKYEKYLAYWVSEKDRGQTHALNKGYRKATGQLRGWLNADEEYLAGALYKVAEVFQQDPFVDYIFGQRIDADKEGTIIGETVYPNIHPFRFMFYGLRVLPTDASFWSSRIHYAAGELDEYFQHFSMDCDWLLRIAAHTKRWRRLPDFLSVFKHHDSQKTLNCDADVLLSNFQYARKKLTYQLKISKSQLLLGWLYIGIKRRLQEDNLRLPKANTWLKAIGVKTRSK